MRAERVVQIHVAALTTIGAMLLGMGQKSPTLPFLVVFAAVTSLVFTDILNWFRLHRAVANLAALAALFSLFFSIDDFVRPNTRSQLMAIANLLVYLQITSFYQRKSSRIYWHLIVFSLLQVVVSAALNVEFEFGVMLIIYVAVGISTLGFFFGHREICQVLPPPDRLLRRGANRAATETDAKDDYPWKPLTRREMVVTPVASRRLLSRQVVSWGFLGEIAAIGLTTMVFSVVLFFSAPRMESSELNVRRARGTSVVGFSREVALNELTDVLQSDEPVMRVSFEDYQTETPYLVFGDPYIRGAVLSEYIVVNGVSKWRQGVGSTGGDEMALGNLIGDAIRDLPQTKRSWRLPPLPANQQLVRQDIILLPIDSPVLFAVFPAFAEEGTPRDVQYNPYTGQLTSHSRRQEMQPYEYPYSLATSAFRGGLQIDITPHENQLKTLADHYLLVEELEQLIRFDESTFPRLKQIADEIAKEQRAQGRNQAALARALRDHFQNPELYTYSLNFSEIPRKDKVDPIEDFVANHRTGHCEYYASALAMMLRSQGIPSRLVTGFKPSEYNEVGGYYQVLQSDAHCWVEAYLPRQGIVGEVPPGTHISPGGGWLRLEPTLGAADDADSVHERGLMDVVDDVLDHARTLWSDYVMGLTARRQQESIYGPVSEGTDPVAWEAFLGQLQKEREAILGFLRGQAAMLAALVAALLAGFYLMLKRFKRANPPPIVRVVQRWTSRLTNRPNSRRQSAHAQRIVDFYRRFENLLAGAGIMRHRSQTQRELAAEACQRLAARSSAVGIEGLISRIVDAFYCVRFGRIALDEQETKAIENALKDLETEMTTNHGNSATNH
ncbi:MAG: DUF3488 domain-containing protein [Planctomycetes bacterium]|nr:DUF3488 domain-containing protein [Planctomycetota bacterium]MBL7040840.1 DUF3488 domain-containing protein [Pirellulaceae bacterium]